MSTIKTLATGSDGNSYVIKADNGEMLILDFGIPWKSILEGCDFDYEHIVGGVCSHVHWDHFKGVDKAIKAGIKVFQPYLDTEHKRLKTRLGAFAITSFDVPHNGTENRGFVIEVDGTRILYATDFEYIRYCFNKQKINVFLIEMNYQEESLSDESHLAHQVLGHSSDRTTLNFLKQNIDSARTIIFCHMSKSNFDKELARIKIEADIPGYIKTYFAIPGQEIDISEVPF